jgi:hypothetical protein
MEMQHYCRTIGDVQTYLNDKEKDDRDWVQHTFAYGNELIINLVDEILSLKRERHYHG